VCSSDLFPDQRQRPQSRGAGCRKVLLTNHLTRKGKVAKQVADF
jgi:hypothetical protein